MYLIQKQQREQKTIVYFAKTWLTLGSAISIKLHLILLQLNSNSALK